MAKKPTSGSLISPWPSDFGPDGYGGGLRTRPEGPVHFVVRADGEVIPGWRSSYLIREAAGRPPVITIHYSLPPLPPIESLGGMEYPDIDFWRRGPLIC